MVVLVGGAITICIVTGGAAAPVMLGAANVGAGAAAGTAAGVATTAVTTLAGTAGTVAGTGAMGGLAGASLGAAAGGSLAATATGAATGAATSAGLTAAQGAIGAGLAAGPIGWAILGCDTNDSTSTFDCWKPLLHNTSTKATAGMLLRDVLKDSRIRGLRVSNPEAEYPMIVLENIWNEQFVIEYVMQGDKLYLHAKLLEN